MAGGPTRERILPDSAWVIRLARSLVAERYALLSRIDFRNSSMIGECQDCHLPSTTTSSPTPGSPPAGSTPARQHAETSTPSRRGAPIPWDGLRVLP